MPPPFRHRSVKQDRMEGLCLVLFGRTKGLQPLAKYGQTKGLRSVMAFIRAERRLFIQPNRIEQRPFVWSCLAERYRKGEGCGRPERTDAGELKERWKRADARKPGEASGEHVPKSGGRVLRKREEMEEREMVPKRGKGTVPERRLGGDRA